MISFIAIPVHALEIRGAVAGTVNGASNLVDNTFAWNAQTFAGFDYDIDHDVGNENLLTTNLTGDYKLSGDAPYGIVYKANNRIKAFENAQLGMKYGKLRVRTIDSTTGTITLDNRGNAFSLSKNKNIEIMPGIYIRTADNDTLRYYIYKNITEPGTYELRGSVAGTINGQSILVDNTFTWNPQNFAGFYYDIKKDLGTENLMFVLSGDGGNKLSGDAPYGVTYTTIAQFNDYKFKDWGSYTVIGFQGRECFAGYRWGGGSPLYGESIDKNFLSSEQLEKILMDDDTKMTVKMNESIKLKEGYDLFLKGMNSNGQIYLELQKDGKIIDESFLAPSVYGATIDDKTYCYRTNVGSQKGLVTIAVHFSGTYKDEERALAVVDGIWQISETPIDVRSDTQYDKMTIRIVDATAGTITMDNKDNPITLTRKSDIDLMTDIHIRTADNDTLRYYIYRNETVGNNSM